jgi:hypothetical protein
VTASVESIDITEDDQLVRSLPEGQDSAADLAPGITVALKDNKLPIAKYLINTPSFGPANPDPIANFDVPAEPVMLLENPYGN